MKKQRRSPEDDEFFIPDMGLESLAREIHRLFIDARRRMVPNAAGCSYDRNAKAFIRAAKLCRQLNMPAAQFVSQQVHALAVSGGAIWPTGLGSIQVAVDAGQGEVSLPLQTIQRFQAQCELFVSRTRMYGEELAVLDTVNEFTPLFRYCMAIRVGTPAALEMAMKCRDAAKIELAECPYLAPALTAWIEGLR